MLSKITLLAAGLCFAVAPAMAGELVPVDDAGPTMMSDAQMEDVVGGVVILRYLRTGKIIGEDPEGNPIYKQIDKPKQGGKQYDGEGPSNNGVTSFQDFDVSGGSGLVTVDGRGVGNPSGRGAAFITVNLNI